MNAIKLPKKSIEFFKSNQEKIFKSGELSEGPWNDKLSKKIKTITNAKNAIGVNSNGSGLVALLLIYKEFKLKKSENYKSILNFSGRHVAGASSKSLNSKVAS